MVLSSNYAHRQHVEIAARHGKHIFCEKPIATSIEDADAMIRAVEKAGVVNSVNYSLRFIPAYIKLRELYRSGMLGDLLSISCLRLRGYGLYASGVRHRAVVNPQESGGWVVHHACHAIDFIYWTAGEYETVYARTESTAPEGPELVWGIGKLKEGGTGIVTDSVCAAREHYATIIGTKATAIMHGEGQTQIVVTKETSEHDARVQETYEVEDYKYNQESLAHFFECIREGKQSRSTLRGRQRRCRQRAVHLSRPARRPSNGKRRGQDRDIERRGGGASGGVGARAGRGLRGHRLRQAPAAGGVGRRATARAEAGGGGDRQGVPGGVQEAAGPSAE